MQETTIELRIPSVRAKEEMRAQHVYEYERVCIFTFSSEKAASGTSSLLHFLAWSVLSGWAKGAAKVSWCTQALFVTLFNGESRLHVRLSLWTLSGRGDLWYPFIFFWFVNKSIVVCLFVWSPLRRGFAAVWGSDDIGKLQEIVRGKNIRNCTTYEALEMFKNFQETCCLVRIGH